MNPFRSTQKHPGERIAEWSIRIIASFSILVIFLIFIFVFREAATLFTAKHEAPVKTAVTEADTDLRPELYNPDVMTAEERADLDEPEIYNPLDGEEGAPVTARPAPQIAAAVDEDSPEVYNPDAVMAEPAPHPAKPSVAAEPPASHDVATTSRPTPTKPAAEPAAEPEPKSLWQKLMDAAWQPVGGDQPKFGIVPLLIGTAKTTFIAILIGAPLGILAAIYSAFFAKRRVREIIKPTIELLAGFPSVVIGFFCMFTVASFVQDVLGTDMRLNALVGGIGLSLAVIPIVFTIAEDSLSAVPQSLRAASLALGSTEWQTAYRVMLPAAAPGVFAAVLLGIGRAFGETMIAIMATGNAPASSWSIVQGARTVAATIGSEMGEVVWGSEHYGILFLLGVMLFIFSFGLNAITELYVKQRFIKRFQGK